MSDAAKFAFLQATAPLCPDMQREIWRWKEIMEATDELRTIRKRKRANQRRRNRRYTRK